MIKKFKIFESNIEFKGDEPDWIVEQIDEIEVDYINFNDELKSGIIICNKHISDDLIKIFEELKSIKFPIFSIIPISNFDWDDDKTCEANNTSCFNYRKVMGTDKISDHGKGMAIDINPMQNPWITPRFGSLPKGSKYNINDKGTINKEVTDIFSNHNFLWGGDWKNPDYQHFYRKI